MWETYQFTATHVYTDRRKWSAVSARNETEAKWKIYNWITTEPGWEGYLFEEGSIEVNDKKWENRYDYPGYECGEFFN